VIVSASSLVRHCGYVRALKKLRKPTADQQAAMDRGTLFHQAIEAWAKTRTLPMLPDMEMQGWIDLMSMEWVPPVDFDCEIAWGLGLDGAFVPVIEPEPHVYGPLDGVTPLLTAGRADGAWWNEGVDVADWKTGRWPVTPAVDNLQANAAGIALARAQGATSYRPGIYYARDGFWDWGPRVVFGTPAYERIWGEIRMAALLDETPRPGPHCKSCWERRGCAHAEPVGSSPDI